MSSRCYEYFEEMEMDMSSFEIQQILSSLEDYKDESYLDIKPLVSHNNIPIISETPQIINKMIRNNLKSEPDPNQFESPIAKASSSRLISFGGSLISPLETDNFSEAVEEMVYNNDAHAATRDPLQSQYHVEAERRRREKLTQLFISLSKILPGLKKLDKASLLDHAINHMKNLQERVTVLEDQTNRSSNNAIDSPEIINPTVEDPSFLTGTRNPIQEIKVRISSSTMLINLICEKEQKLVQKILEELGKLHLTVSDFRVLPFGCNTLVVTIHVQVDSEIPCTVNDVTTQLENAFLYQHDMGRKCIKLANY